MSKKSPSIIKLQNMSKRNLKSFNKTEAQGWIINSSIKIEGLINDIIFRYFEPENPQVFHHYVLNSSIMHYGGKLKVLKAIGIDIKTYSNLQQIGSIRNAFAHTNITNQMNINSDGTTEVFDIISVMNSQGIVKAKDPYEYLLMFLDLYKNVEPKLIDMREALNVKE